MVMPCMTTSNLVLGSLAYTHHGGYDRQAFGGTPCKCKSAVNKKQTTLIRMHCLIIEDITAIS